MNSEITLSRRGRQQLAKAVGARHGEPWRPGKRSSEIVSDASGGIEGTLDADQWRYYGGRLVAESMETSERDRAIACVNFCAGVELPEGDDMLDGFGGLRLVLDSLEVCYRAALRGEHAFEDEHELVTKMEQAEAILRHHGRQA